MINQLLLAGTVAVIALGLTAPVLVFPRGTLTRDQPRQVELSASTAQASLGPVRTEPAGEAGFLGVVVARRSVDLSARFDATLDALNVQVGDAVKGGTAIARLDDRAIARDLAMAEAALRAAEAEHDRCVVEADDASERRARLNRIPELVAREQIAAAESQEKVAAARLRASAADLAGKRVRVDQMREMRRDAHIIAPFDGTVAARFVDSGANVGRGTPIVRLISPASLAIRFAVPEGQAAEIAVGREVMVYVASADLTVAGAVDRIVPEIDAALRMVVVEARLAGDRTDTISAGAIVRVQFPVVPTQHGRGRSIDPPLSASDASTGHERPID